MVFGVTIPSANIFVNFAIRSQTLQGRKELILGTTEVTQVKQVVIFSYFDRFVKLVRSKTPKVTMYTNRAKCMLMENSPDADFEAVFYDGRLQWLHCVLRVHLLEMKLYKKLPPTIWCILIVYYLELKTFHCFICD